MAITCEERINSPRITQGTDRVSIERQFVIKGTASYADALDALDSAAGASFTIGTGSTSVDYSRQEISIEPESEDLWNGSARYGSSDATGGGSGAIGDSSFSFDTGGGTQHVTTSKTQTVYGVDGSSGTENFENAIGYDGQNVNGIDIVIPQFQWTETHIKGTDSVTSLYKRTVAALTGKVNDAGFRGFNAGEVLFVGASGTRTGTERWSITFKFAYSPNQTNLLINPQSTADDQITVATKKGWEYLWVRFKDKPGVGQVLKAPEYAVVDKVYDAGNFSDLGIGTS